MKKNISRLLTGMLICLFFSNTGYAASIPELFNTGVDSTGNVISIGSLEEHYIMTGGYTSHVIGVNSAWITPPSDASWIGPYDEKTTAPITTYYYSLTFDLTGLDPNTAIINGDWATDNDATMFLNGQYTGNFRDIYGYETLAPFTVSSGFLPGANILEFRVNNSPSLYLNPTALLVSNITGSATPVPIPATFFFLAPGLAGLIAARRRLSR